LDAAREKSWKSNFREVERGHKLKEREERVDSTFGYSGENSGMYTSYRHKKAKGGQKIKGTGGLIATGP